MKRSSSLLRFPATDKTEKRISLEFLLLKATWKNFLQD
jgi:hypothetical protein